MAKKPIKKLFALLLITPGALAAVQDLRLIDQQVREYVARPEISTAYQYEAEKVDPRLRLPACLQPLTLVWPAEQREPYSALAVSCQQSRWRILVPVKSQEKAYGFYTTRQIRAGEVLQIQDIQLLPINNKALASQALREQSLVIGKAALTTISANSVIRVTQLRQPIVVKMSQPVRVEVRASNFNISSDGVALGSASVGDRVNVRMASGKIVSGVVQEDLTILLSAP